MRDRRPAPPAAIQPLPAETAALIAAGEVIDSPAAAVRELVENALDAGATRLDLSLWLDRGRVRLADNGCGMARTDLERAALPHSTSKIRDCADLAIARTLGFRGEALHGLARLSRLEIVSRPVAESHGWQVAYGPDGEPVRGEPAALAPGTVVLADDLFGNWPARRESLPPAARQWRAIQQVIFGAALCHPPAAWQVRRDDRLWFSIAPGPTAQQILPQLLRQLRFGDLQALSVAVAADGAGNWPPDGLTNPLRPGAGDGPAEAQWARSREPPADPRAPAWLELTLGLPDRAHRRRPDWVKVGVNGRLVRAPELEQAVLAAYGRMLPRDRFPVAFVHLRMPPGAIDWNRTPAKDEIYLKRSDCWEAAIRAAIARGLALGPMAESATYRTQRGQQVLRAASATGRYAAGGALGTGEFAAAVLQPGVSSEGGSSEESATGSALPVLSLRAIAQASRTYIVAEHPGGLWLVEQHVAHERVLYETLRDRWRLVPLERAIVLAGLSDRERSQLDSLGMAAEPFGEDLWAVRSAPEPLAGRSDCAEALRELARGADLEAAQVATACRTAIRNGQPLSLAEMQELLDRWQHTQNPRTCPHGRPIYLPLEESSLARFFRRHWVIGKSHGI